MHNPGPGKVNIWLLLTSVISHLHFYWKSPIYSTVLLVALT